METIKSADGRYEITHNSDYTGWANLVEYAGFAPRREVSRTSIPFELLATLMDKMLFNVTSTASIAVISEPSKSEFVSEKVLD